jgi:hypothetical protein
VEDALLRACLVVLLPPERHYLLLLLAVCALLLRNPNLLGRRAHALCNVDLLALPAAPRTDVTSIAHLL